MVNINILWGGLIATAVALSIWVLRFQGNWNTWENIPLFVPLLAFIVAAFVPGGKGDPGLTEEQIRDKIVREIEKQKQKLMQELAEKNEEVLKSIKQAEQKSQEAISQMIKVLNEKAPENVQQAEQKSQEVISQMIKVLNEKIAETGQHIEKVEGIQKSLSELIQKAEATKDKAVDVLFDLNEAIKDAENKL